MGRVSEFQLLLSETLGQPAPTVGFIIDPNIARITGNLKLTLTEGMYSQ